MEAACTRKLPSAVLYYLRHPFPFAVQLTSTQSGTLPTLNLLLSLFFFSHCSNKSKERWGLISERRVPDWLLYVHTTGPWLFIVLTLSFLLKIW